MPPHYNEDIGVDPSTRTVHEEKRPVQRRNRTWSRKELDEAVHAGRAVFIYKNNVYDMTRWLPNHPGGELAVQRLIGRDATDVISVMHPQDVLQRMLPLFCVGRFLECKQDKSVVQGVHAVETIRQSTPKNESNLVSNSLLTKEAKEKPDNDNTKQLSSANLNYEQISRDFQILNDRLHEEGYFNTHYSAYAWEAARLVLFFSVAIYLGIANPFRYAWLASAIVLSMFWHQASFVVHDAGHNGITHHRGTDYMLGAFLACGMGGLSIGWWKKSHNVHHIITNHPEHDPDIQLVPFFALSEDYFGSVYSSYHNKTLQWNRVWRAFARIQHYLYYIILAFGRFNLFVQGWLHLALEPNTYRRNTEVVLQCCYWVWYYYFLSCLPDTTTRLLHVLVSFVGTSILHVQITLSHFGMPADEGPEDECFAARQLRTTMDVDCPWWLDWFHGGLQFQALHHLFPQLPRHRLRSIQPFVMDFCKKHNITYTYNSFYECNRMVIASMRNLAIKAALTNI
ncbi:delta-6 fatty acid desaturase [Syncephalis plumigaleata]|nr:delta-6 fatty acid desaturase [Syncephalis plumigaleata]